jgi:hypothetical protein
VRLDVSQPYGPSRPVARIALPFNFIYFVEKRGKCKAYIYTHTHTHQPSPLAIKIKNNKRVSIIIITTHLRTGVEVAPE